jgi:coiled-coil domain-containing protein 12
MSDETTSPMKSDDARNPRSAPAAEDSDSSSDSSDSDSDSDSSSDDERPELETLCFRSYKPYDPELQKKMLPPVSILDDLEWVESELKVLVENTKKTEDSLANIVPRKINWDLKRDLAPKLSVLEAQTQRAIAEMVREKITKQDGQT